MHTIAKGFGLPQVLVGVAVVFLGASIADGNAVASFSVIGIAFGIIVSGALFWCFGSIVDHLIAIRRALEVAPYEAKAPFGRTVDMSRWSAADRDRYLQQQEAQQAR
jgi:Na+/melibiose symporter-like transporter